MKYLLLAAAFFQPLVNADVLEPSVRNEVEHAIERASAFEEMPSKAATNTAAKVEILLPRDIFGTNGLDKTQIAIKLVSAQKPDGRWLYGTNDVTKAALQVLKSL